MTSPPSRMLKKLVLRVPDENPSLHDQKDLTEASDQLFMESVCSKETKLSHVIFQVFYFFLFLGPIRMVAAALLGVASGVFAIITEKLGIVDHPLCYLVHRVLFRGIVFFLGQVKIVVKGDIDPNSRIFISNHIGFNDPFYMILRMAMAPISKIELDQNPFFGPIIRSSTSLFVDRTHPCGLTKVVKERAADHKDYPLYIFPEGTTTNGEVMLKFHCGSFVSDEQVQPLALRLYVPFVPKGWNTPAWIQPSFAAHIFALLSLPPNIVVIEPLKPMHLKDYKDPTEFANAAHLVLANHLGVLAINRSSHEIYRKDFQSKEC